MWMHELYPFLSGLLIGIGISWLYRIAMDIEDSYDRRYDPDHPTLSGLRGGLYDWDDDERAEFGISLDPCEHPSATGVDQSDGPDKVWRCDSCGWLFRDEPSPDDQDDDERAEGAG